MAVLPPIPYDKPQTSFEWIDWYTKLIDLVNSGTSHNDLPGIQGGTVGEYYHLTSAQQADLTDGGFTTAHKHEMYPVGSVYTSTSSDDPSILLTYGTWTLLGTITL